MSDQRIPQSLPRSKVTGYTINTQKGIIFPCGSHEDVETESKTQDTDIYIHISDKGTCTWVISRNLRNV